MTEALVRDHLFENRIIQYQIHIDWISVSQHGTALLIFASIPLLIGGQTFPRSRRRTMPVYEPWNAERGAAIIAELTHVEGGTLVILHALQEAFGYVPERSIPMIAAWGMAGCPMKMEWSNSTRVACTDLRDGAGRSVRFAGSRRRRRSPSW